MRAALFTSVGVFLIAILASVFGFAQIPPGQPIAVHWSIDGVADGFAPRAAVFTLGPAMIAIAALLFAMAVRVEPRQENLDASRGLIGVAWIGTICILGLAHVCIVLAATGTLSADEPFRVIPVAIAVFFMFLGNMLAKSRSTFFFGVRTPWTLSSEQGWKAANRFVGLSFVLIGAIGTVVAAFGETKTSLYILVAGSLSAALVGAVISYTEWRRDPLR